MISAMRAGVSARARVTDEVGSGRQRLGEQIMDRGF